MQGDPAMVWPMLLYSLHPAMVWPMFLFCLDSAMAFCCIGESRKQFTKSIFRCLLPVFVPIRAIKWLFFIEFDLFGQSEC